VLRSAGVEISWVDCALSQAEFVKYPGCQSNRGVVNVALRLLPRRMAEKFRTPNDSLGFARPCPESEGGCEANVFCDRVDDLARNGYREDLILGHVIAHELGHVLIGPGHSDTGIMRGQWSRDDLRRISWGVVLHFSNTESARLRSAVLQRMAGQ
jgi:hypothetical protein